MRSAHRLSVPRKAQVPEVAGGERYDERFVHFVVLFNVDEDYFECHEVMEELWLEEGRNRLYQGLLQAAVGLHHWRNDNYSGAVKLFSQAENKLVHYSDTEMGLNLLRLRGDIARCLGPLSEWLGGEPGRPDDKARPAVPPSFEPFRIEVTDDELRLSAEAMALIPLAQRLHFED